VFRRPNDTETKKLRRQVEQLEEKLGKKNEVLGELLEEYVDQKSTWGALKEVWVPREMRDQVVDVVEKWAEKSDRAC